MLPIYICEDNLEQRHFLENIIHDFLIFHDMDMKLVLSTKNPLEILEYKKNTTELSVYFIDINLENEIDGITLSVKLRQLDPWGFIIFITSHKELMPLTYQNRIAAMDFIVKGNPEIIREKVQNCLNEIWSRYKHNNPQIHNYFVYKDGKMHYTIHFADIYYIESSCEHHKIIINKNAEALQIVGSLKDTLKHLPPDFIYCNRNTIVNKKHVIAFDKQKSELQLDNGKKCHVSSRLLHLF